MLNHQRPSLIGFLVAALLIPFHSLTAQNQPEIAVPKDGLGEIKVLKRPEAVYPDEAKRQGLTGTVIVEIVIDEEGKVRRPRAITGHPILRPFALEAARGWEFERARIDGAQPTKILGAISFCFQANQERSKSKLVRFERCCPQQRQKRDDWCAASK
jgi:TonB family protein